MTALVTGASRGIGRGIAVELGRLGWKVVVNYAGNLTAATECVALVKEAGGDAVAVQGDISVAADRERLVRAALELGGGRIELLVNNAGVPPKVRADILEATEESFSECLSVNLQGPYFLTQRVGRLMAEQSSGQIVTITSISAYTASVNRGEYCVAKAGLSMMTQLFAARLAEFGVRVYEIRPGVVATDMTAGVREKYDAMIGNGAWPIKRWGTPDDVARAVGAIARGDFPFSTGAVLDVDGGWRVRTL
jgi:NAD(P)-dependent dehydrogenase (short-subunit alcohol dehydrogenase family)